MPALNSFADLKNLQISLRNKEANEAQDKKHLNPLKKRAPKLKPLQENTPYQTKHSVKKANKRVKDKQYAQIKLDGFKLDFNSHDLTYSDKREVFKRKKQLEDLLRHKVFTLNDIHLAQEDEEFQLAKLDLLSFIEDKNLAYQNRLKLRPKVTYPNLPVSERKDEIIDAIKNNQVVIIAGETGSGKTTQLPKMCLEANLGIKGLIGHTQPRRLAARAVAMRIASELNENLGHSVSYKVRFSDISSDNAYIKLMTDGILLSELSYDRLLLDYEVIIIDEAHERSLNIDFLLGYLKTLLSKRPELKVIITSATIDVERFSRHFNHAPIIEVSGRTYPVEVVYMPLMEDERGIYIEDHHGNGRFEGQTKQHNNIDFELENGPGAWREYHVANKKKPSENSNTNDEIDYDGASLQEGILRAIKYLQHRGRGDILIFLPGERDILELSKFLRKASLVDTEIIPLYARLATNEQNKIFSEHDNLRIVLATNVAETSLTVPGIRYVIDPGLARISRYSARTKVQRLPIERISQASANQRKGRCGRVSDGICVRLYSKDDFINRPEFTDPEILRTNLASVLLQMTSLSLGSIESFPFIDAPSPRQISDGLRLLDELGATYVKKIKHKGSNLAYAQLSGDLKLTHIGKIIARLPCDPRLGRMIVEADKNRALNEILIIVSALAVIDPREYPLDKKEAALNMHKRFNDEKSDFLAFINLYNYIRELQMTLSASALRRQLKSEFISFLRVREWMDVHRQLRASIQMLGMTLNTNEASYEDIHKSLISGLLSQVGMVEVNNHQYIGARGSKFLIFPGSSLAKKSPKWLCAAELTETSRLFARTVASIDPSYIEQAAQSGAKHLLKNSYSEIHWSKKQGAVMAYLTRSLYGLPIVQKRIVQYQNIDPNLCYEMMIKEGFVNNNIDLKHRFLRHNQDLISDVEYLEDKVRRRDLLVDETTLEHFYQQRIPSYITNVRDFEKWWQKKRQEDEHFLDFSYELIAKEDALNIQDNLYPEYWHQGALRFKLSYLFDITSDRDGVSVHIPITVLNQVKVEEFLWQIDGLREELFASLIRSLPKRLRRNLIPAPEYAKALSESLQPYIQFLSTSEEEIKKGNVPKIYGKSIKKIENLFVAVAKELTRMGGELVSVEDFDKSQIPHYLFMNFCIEDVSGKELAFGKDFIALSSRMQNKAREVLHKVVKTHTISAPAQDWEYGTIKREQITQQGSLKITAYPALTDKGDGVTLELYDTKERQDKAMLKGAVKLMALSLKTPTSYLESHLPNRAKLALYYQALGSIQELIFDLTLASIHNIMMRNGGVPWDEESFKRLREIVRGELNDEALALAQIIEKSLVKAHELKRLLKGKISFDLARSYADLNQQLDNLIYKGFISQCDLKHLKEMPRYLEAALERIKKLNRDVVRDQMYMRTLEGLQEDYQKALNSYHSDSIPEPLKEVKWMIEELRVSYFAQQLGVIGPISDKRISNELNHILKEWPAQK